MQEPNNLTNKSSFRYSGLVQRKTVGVNFAPDKKGFVLVLKKPKAQGRPSKTYTEVKMKHAGFRRPLKKLRNTLVKNKYRKDLTKVTARCSLRKFSLVLVALHKIKCISEFSNNISYFFTKFIGCLGPSQRHPEITAATTKEIKGKEGINETRNACNVFLIFVRIKLWFFADFFVLVRR